MDSSFSAALNGLSSKPDMAPAPQSTDSSAESTQQASSPELNALMDRLNAVSQLLDISADASVRAQLESRKHELQRQIVALNPSAFLTSAPEPPEENESVEDSNLVSSAPASATAPEPEPTFKLTSRDLAAFRRMVVAEVVAEFIREGQPKT